MNKLKAFLIADGIFVLVGILFFAFLFFRKQKGSDMGGFRDDLWIQEERKRSSTGNSQAVEDKIDKKILLEDNRIEAKEQPKSSETKAEFRYPNFRGNPYEVLGIPPSADKDMVARAYKHWMKKYHPDRVSHLGSEHIEQAKVRAGQLNRAREEILKRMS